MPFPFPPPLLTSFRGPKSEVGECLRSAMRHGINALNALVRRIETSVQLRPLKDSRFTRCQGFEIVVEIESNFVSNVQSLRQRLQRTTHRCVRMGLVNQERDIARDTPETRKAICPIG